MAARANVSKQAIHPLIDDLVEMGTVERIADPTDKRAKLVRFTKQGRFNMLKGLELLGALEQEMAEEIGEKQMRALHTALLKVHDVLVEKSLEDLP